MSELLSFISSIIGSISWPLSIIIIVILLKAPISKLLARLGKLKYGEFEAEFNKEMDIIKSNIEESRRGIKIAGSADIIIEVNKTLSKEIEEIARVSPEAAIPFAWSKVEYSLIEKAKQINIVPPDGKIIQTYKLLNEFIEKGKLSASTYSAIKTMNQLRNSISHNHNYQGDLTINNAIEYGNSAEYIIKEIDMIS